ncbi:SDR family NAD(P)-dependent oxidoreductase [Paenibacillus arenilitoris]|uniref:SDR family NAD(P)-dependent oxidoreductase n=1 Tax=Paenibacillus arenilitoris TaxID=2772299 RepID=A0A927CJE3_9BACL|nr:SDR family NAD(P)-dependent oxidoreductase [Paenibacillus arenilitoris]MBD2867291.1 SDR family NAD(P)-dependent oxidoreductase [Paenibacillus arenilitoris]
MRKLDWLESVLFPRVQLDEKKLAHALNGKTVVITGASSGIGERLAYLLGRLPVHLLLAARRAERLDAMKREIEQGAARVSVYAADLRNEDELGAFLTFLSRLPDGVDAVVSNAGLSIKRSIGDSLDRYHDFTRTMAINYFAPVRLVLSLVPLLEQKQGQIINVSTINTSLVPFPYFAAYQASKQAFDTWLRSAAPELHARGIAATSVYLPLVRTPMIAPTAAYRSMPAMSAEQAARLIARCMYTRRRRAMPWWLPFGELASVAFRSPLEAAIAGRLRKRGTDA